MYKVIIQHGSFGNPSGNWFPYLKEKVSQLGYEYYTPFLPSGDKQSLDSWLSEFQKQTPPLDSQTILIGHSIAPAFFMSLLEETKTKVKGVFLVSGFLRRLKNIPEYDKVNLTFVERKHNWNKLSKLCGKVYLYGAIDDPYVPFSFQQEFAAKLGTKVILIKNGGHLNSESGYIKFPRLFSDLSKLLKSSEQ